MHQHKLFAKLLLREPAPELYSR